MFVLCRDGGTIDCLLGSIRIIESRNVFEGDNLPVNVDNFHG